jgi:hypothetical protein
LDILNKYAYRIHPSAGKKGYKDAIYSAASKDFPNQRFNSEGTAVRLNQHCFDAKFEVFTAVKI